MAFRVFDFACAGDFTFARAFPFPTFAAPDLRRRPGNRGNRICSAGAGSVPARFNSQARHRYHAAADRYGPHRSPYAASALGAGILRNP